jgi:hypothetical protein
MATAARFILFCRRGVVTNKNTAWVIAEKENRWYMSFPWPDLNRPMSIGEIRDRWFELGNQESVFFTPNGRNPLKSPDSKKLNVSKR